MRRFTGLKSTLVQRLQQKRGLFTALGVTGGIVLLRLLGFLQSFELAALDQMFRIRPLEPVDDRILIVTIDDQDIENAQNWPISDAIMADLLEKIQQGNPRAIGLDIYRDLPVEPGHEQLVEVFETLPNLIAIEKIPDTFSIGVSPPASLDADQIGFNNIIPDPDGRVRRSIFYWVVSDEDGDISHTSFALQLSFLYLEAEGIMPRPANDRQQSLQLGEAIFPDITARWGPYANVNTGGYQVFANFRGPTRYFNTVSFSDVREERIDPNEFRDRIVLVGSTAASLQDFAQTPYTGGQTSIPQRMAGVELHANFISQIISAVLDDRALIQTWPEPVELLWILIWALIGSEVSWLLRSPLKSALMTLGASISLFGLCFLAFLQGWWIPLVPPIMALVISAVTITGYLAHLEEELQKSKEFLSSVINTIPDPIFVKDQHHRWIVLNEAYSRFIGYPLETLLQKTDYDVMSDTQAQEFWQQDHITLSSGLEQENEESFTNAAGFTYHIATKRSLHKDSAGNRFLVGVIRDITQRKRMEEDLRRTAVELERSNAELRQAGDSLRRMAYYDPLTGLPNRKMLDEKLQQALSIADDHDKFAAILFLDLDGFKQVNDSYGHRMGDLVLKAVAKRLSGCLRLSDTVARLGGDEFVVLLPAIPTEENVAKVADKIIQTLSKPFEIEDISLAVTTSIGISLYPKHSIDTEDLLTQADAAMYEAKQQGKNRFLFVLTHESHTDSHTNV